VCQAVIKGCWKLLDLNGNDIADYFLSVCMPELESLAKHLSPHRHDAAMLAVEAKIIQVKIAKRKLNFARRVSLGEDTVRIAEMSGDGNIHAMALSWHADTYKDGYHQPGTAIATFNDALKCGDGISSLNKADIFVGLAIAYALDSTQDNYETKARDYAEQAHMMMPDDPELDPLYRLIRTGQAELNMHEGRMYLILAEKFPAKKYAQMAFDAFSKSMSIQPLDIGYRCQTLIHRADAARATGDMDNYLNCLGEGVPIARQTDSEQHIAKAVTIIQKAPRKWRNEQRYIELCKILKPSIAIVRK
jgi:hypothetical protein